MISITKIKRQSLGYRVLDYIKFFIYCEKRRVFCKGYRRLKATRMKGHINQKDYVKSLREIYNDVIELELDYFDIRYLRL